MNQLEVQRDSGDILGLLQEAVNAETISRNLYWLRSVYWENKGLSRLAKYYREQSEESHALVSANRMAFLGRIPQISPSIIDPYEKQTTLREQFETDLKVEGNLASMYRSNIARAAEMHDYITEDIWRKVLAGTEEHSSWLQRQIEQIDEMGEAVYLQSWVDKADRELL